MSVTLMQNRFVPGRDTCSGQCETAAGCDCLRLTSKLTERELDQAIAERRTFVQDAEEERARAHYCRGWRWGVLDGAVLVALAFVFGFNAFKG